MPTDVVPITPEEVPGEVSPFTPLARDQKIKLFTTYPCGRNLELVKKKHCVDHVICKFGPPKAIKNLKCKQCVYSVFLNHFL